MTRVLGDRVIQTNCCEATFRTPAYGSINLSAHEYWTDGRVVGSLFDNGGGLRRCTCGNYFLLNEASTVGTIPKLKPRAPLDWERKSMSVWHRVWGFPTREEVLEIFDTRDPSLIDIEESKLPPKASHVADSTLERVLNSENLSFEIEIVARRRYWRYLNDSYRESYREARVEDQNAIPKFEPTVGQKQNMEKLLNLLDVQHSKNWVEVVELLRELGEPLSAMRALKHIIQSKAKEAALQSKLIDIGVSAPVRFRH